MRNLFLALLLSLLLHTTAGLSLLLLPLQAGKQAECSGVLVDTCILDREVDPNLGKGEISSSAQPFISEQLEATGHVADQEDLVDTAPVLADDSSTGRMDQAHRDSKDRSPLDNTINGFGVGDRRKRATFFQLAADGKTIVYVIDRSASMGLNGLLAIAKQELLASLAELSPESRFQIIMYNRLAESLRVDGQVGLVAATVHNKEHARILLDALVAEGGTEHLRALRRALALQPDVIFFLTDAADLKADQIRTLTLQNRGRTIIHAIELLACDQRTRGSSLANLARDNRGVYRQITAGPHR